MWNQIHYDCRLLARGKNLEDGRTLKYYDIQNLETLLELPKWSNWWGSRITTRSMARRKARLSGLDWTVCSGQTQPPTSPTTDSREACEKLEVRTFKSSFEKFVKICFQRTPLPLLRVRTASAATTWRMVRTRTWSSVRAEFCPEWMTSRKFNGS